jgi:hypothetical protein
MLKRWTVLILALAACGDDSGGGGGGDAAPAGPPTAFRFSDLDLRDPHIMVDILGNCSDVTNSGVFVVNDEIENNITMDTDDDGKLELSPTIVFRPLAQGSASGAIDVYFADCTAPIAGTMCVPGSTAPIRATATNMPSGSCLTPEAGTTTASYTPAITSPSGPCFVSDAQSITVDLSGIIVMLRDARVAATYVGSPATGLMNGLLMGFLTEADADAAILPEDLPLVGGQPVSSVLPGGTDNCATNDDKDTHDGASGWWFYLNFPATMAPWTD